MSAFPPRGGGPAAPAPAGAASAQARPATSAVIPDWTLIPGMALGLALRVEVAHEVDMEARRHHQLAVAGAPAARQEARRVVDHDRLRWQRPLERAGVRRGMTDERHVAARRH